MTGHPWADFLDARKKTIVWMKDECGRTDQEIAIILSMDARQVASIIKAMISFGEYKLKEDYDTRKKR